MLLYLLQLDLKDHLLHARAYILLYLVLSVLKFLYLLLQLPIRQILLGTKLHLIHIFILHHYGIQLLCERLKSPLHC